MRQNVTKKNTVGSESNQQTRKLTPEQGELERLRLEVRTKESERKLLEERLAKLQNIFHLMAQNFSGGMIFVLKRENRNELPVVTDPINMLQLGTEQNGIRHNVPLSLDEDTLMKIENAFKGEITSCEINLSGRFYHVTAAPVPDNRNAISEVLCVLQDFTDQKSMEEGLLKALQKEKELGELKSRFVTMASHEFRTPLTMILSSTFLIEASLPENFETERKLHTNRIKRAVNNLTLILNEFLSLEKLEQNKVQVVNAEVNIPEFIEDTLSEMDVIKRERQVIKYHHVGETWIARIDHHLMWSIVTNLTSNSLKYSKVGDTIEITSEINSSDLIFTVQDSGIGIPQDEQQFIFGRFFRARNATNFEGTGLGLHIIQKYIHLLNGTITFESQLDAGTTFTVILPVGPGEPLSTTGSS